VRAREPGGHAAAWWVASHSTGTVERGRGRTALSALGDRRDGCPGSGCVGRSAVRGLTAGPRTAIADSQPLLRSLYDACSSDVSSSRPEYEQQGGIRSPKHGNHPGSQGVLAGDLALPSRSGRPVLIGAFHETTPDGKRVLNRADLCLVNVPEARRVNIVGDDRTQPSVRRSCAGRYRWLCLGIIIRGPGTAVAGSSACPSEEGHFDGGEGRGGVVRPVRPSALP
jgi:hypothetical protein